MTAETQDVASNSKAEAVDGIEALTLDEFAFQSEQLLHSHGQFPFLGHNICYHINLLTILRLKPESSKIRSYNTSSALRSAFTPSKNN